MSIPAELEPWVAGPNHGRTHLVDPCYVDYRFVADVGDWHPGNLAVDKYLFKHVAAGPASDPYAIVADPSSDWDGELIQIMLKLKLYPKKDADGVDCLLDDRIGGADVPTIGGWKVILWKVVKGRGTDTGHQVVHHDLITWVKNGVERLSMFSWIPYDDETGPQSRRTSQYDNRS